MVQLRVEHEGHEPAWEDVATVTVPARSKRKTVIEKALDIAGPESAVPEGSKLRVLDEESARESVVGWEQPPPRLNIS